MRHVRFHGHPCATTWERSSLKTRANTLFYSFFNADRIMDFLLSIGMKPFVELSFMPTMALSSGRSRLVFHYRANVTAPATIIRKWATLIRRN